ncbi:MAG: PhnD/SsuA/transferrin family substrate-binding protein [Pseudomonadota bacterium]|nr:PhnD/SsuA/transferrin family substrate-binding protein [Pseudomonadota bacterium]
MPIANARMYSVTAACAADWKTVFAWALSRAGLDWPLVDVDPPVPIATLWARDDLGAVMMCGLPYTQRVPKPTLIAAPLPSPARYHGRALYFTDLVVAAASAHRTLEDTFDGVVGYTLAGSMSGGVAMRAHLAPFRSAARPRLYARSVGGLIHARGVIEALARGEIDVGPLDGYCHDLLKQHDPEFAAQVRTVASTEAMPIPPIVATAAVGEIELARLRAAFRAAARAPELVEPMKRLMLSGFTIPLPSDYDVLTTIARHGANVPFEEL